MESNLERIIRTACHARIARVQSTLMRHTILLLLARLHDRTPFCAMMHEFFMRGMLLSFLRCWDRQGISCLHEQKAHKFLGDSLPQPPSIWDLAGIALNKMDADLNKRQCLLTFVVNFTITVGERYGLTSGLCLDFAGPFVIFIKIECASKHSYFWTKRVVPRSPPAVT